MKLSFLVAGLCLITAYSQVDAGTVSDCERRALATKDRMLSTCLGTPFNIMRLHAMNNNANPNPIEKYVCKSYENAMDCILSSFASDLSLGPGGTCNLKDFHSWIKTWMLEVASSLEGVTGSPNPDIFDKCKDYDAMLQCPDRDNIKTAIVAHCPLHVMALSTLSTDAKCIQWSTCYAELQKGYIDSAGAVCPLMKGFFEAIAVEDLNEFSTLIGFNLAGCDSCVLKTAPLWAGIAECLQTPLRLLILSARAPAVDNYPTMICDAFTLAVACIRFRYAEKDELGLETGTCSLQTYMPLFIEYIKGTVAEPYPALVAKVDTYYQQCSPEFDSLTPCPSNQGLKTAIIAHCAPLAIDYSDSGIEAQCRAVLECSNALKKAYKEGYVALPTCDTDAIFDSILYDSAQLTTFNAISNITASQCFNCRSRVEYIKEGIMESLGTPVGLVKLGKHFGPSSSQFPAYLDMICPAYSIAIGRIRNLYGNALGLNNGACSIANDFHTEFLASIKESANVISQVEERIVQCTGSFTSALVCPDKESVKIATVAHCASDVMDNDMDDYKDVQCVIFGTCFQKLKAGYLKEGAGCNIEEVFDDLSTNVIDNEEFAGLTGFNPLSCEACISRVASVAEGISSCLGTPYSLLRMSAYYDLTRSDTRPYICKSYYVAIGCVKAFYAAQLGLNDNSCSLMNDFHPLFIRWLTLLARGSPGLRNQADIFDQCTDSASIQAAGTTCPDTDDAKTALVSYCAQYVLAGKDEEVAKTCGYLDECIDGLKAAYRLSSDGCDTDSVFDTVTTNDEDIAEFSGITSFPIAQCAEETVPELAICSDVDELFTQIFSGGASSCVNTFTEILFATEFDIFCEKFWVAMRCAAERLVPNNVDGCLGKMRQKVNEDPMVIVRYLRDKAMLGDMLQDNTIGYASRANTCGGGDLPVCSSMTGIMDEVLNKRATSCIMDFGAILEAGSFDTFCMSFWKAFECTASAIAEGNENDKQQCLRQMRMTVENNPTELITLLEQRGLTIPPNIVGYSVRTASCSVGGDDDDLGKEKPVLDELKKCGKRSEVMQAAQTCNLTVLSVGGDCSSFLSIVQCVASNLVNTPLRIGDLYKHLVAQCMDLVTEVLTTYREAFRDRLGNLDPEECKERAYVCGGDVLPVANVDCALMRCPANYTCTRKSYCCPTKKPGMCPKMKETAPCVANIKKRCTVDMDCDGSMKCCDRGCGYMTCEMTEVREKSMCEMSLERTKDRLYTQGACGDGTGVLEVPQCQNSMYAPSQGDLASGVFFCVFENGTKIAGSEFKGNVDCTRIRAGRCPPKPSVCQNVAVGEDSSSCKNDENCFGSQKCCYTELSSGKCAKTCRDPLNTGSSPFEVCSVGQERHCCPANLMQGKVCHADRTAVPRINPCGGCTVEFYNADNLKVDCNAGVSMCLKKKAMARMMNQDMVKNYASRLKDFFEAHQMYNSMDDMDEMGKGLDLDMDMDMDKDMYKDMDDDDDSDDKDDDKDEYGDKDDNKDEYGEMARKEGEMENDARIEEIYMAYRRSEPNYMAAMLEMTRAFLAEKMLCQNGGDPSIGAEENDGALQLCQCEKGYYGIFCEMSGAPTPNTACTRYKVVTDSIVWGMGQLNGYGNIIHGLLTMFRVDNDVMPTTTCDASGMFTEIQYGIKLPITSNMHMVKYCVNTTTGMRMPYTLVALMDEDLKCSTLVAPDVLTLPMRCRLQPGNKCTDDDMSCQYYYNSVTKMCEKSSRTGFGFDYATQCYMECGLQVLTECPPLNPDAVGICPTCPDEGCPMGQKCCPSECGGTRCKDMYTTPAPCSGAPCNYLTEFCLVEETATGQVGRCKARKPYCMQGADPGYGNKRLGAYYFDANLMRCNKFTYAGQGGNDNRFYTLHQCQTECGVYADYTYPGPVCPIPSAITEAGADMALVDMCYEDKDCGADYVCCSNGRAKVCTSPVSTCGTQRCSPEAKCINDMCVCPTCEDNNGEQVCGSNGMRYPNLCMLKKHACEKMMNITAISCTNTPPPTRSCPMACTKEYKPICAYTMSGLSKVLKTLSNPCALMEEQLCQGISYQILYDGECPKTCGGVTCELFETCVEDKCVCPSCGVNNHPICAHPDGFPEAKESFSSVCAMRRHGCKAGHLYVISSMKACEEPEPMYECPATKNDIVYSAARLCHPQTNAYCGDKSKCCPYGAGYRCIPMNYLQRKTMSRPGFCPIQSYVNFNRKHCFDKRFMCTDDSDVPKNSKCCENLVCGHKTIAVPLGLENEAVCGADKMAIRGMKCDPSPNAPSVCPAGSTCTSVMSDAWTMGVCCQASDAPKRTDMEVYGNNLCNVISDLGRMPLCQNGGTCIGDLENAQMCICPVGYNGAFCEKIVLEYQNPCQRGVFNCFTDPCTGRTCHIDGAVCNADYCGGCFARWTIELTNVDVSDQCQPSKCERLSNIMSSVFSLLPQKDDAMTSRRRRGVPTNTNVDNDEEKEKDEDNGMMYNVFAVHTKKQLEEVMKALKYPYVPMKGIVNCERDGTFSKKQCFESVNVGDDGKDFCTCVHNISGTMIKNAPKTMTLSDLDCSFFSVPEFPQFCLSVPSTGSCSEIKEERYFFSPKMGDCVSYMEMGCNDVDFKNSFESYESCTSVCSSPSVTPVKCETIKCGTGTACKKVKGVVGCYDVTGVMNNDKYPEPGCEMNGDYSPKQCHGDLCYCVQKDGTPLPNSFGDGKTLVCKRDKDGNTVMEAPQESQRKRCPNGGTPMVCDGPGNPCNNCEMPTDTNNNNNRMMADPNVDDDGTCKNCQTCPSGQGRNTCMVGCESMPVCRNFPQASCRVDRCTCTANYYRSDNTVVNCDASQSQCHKEKAAIERRLASEAFLQRISRNTNTEMLNAVELRCTSEGHYLARCIGNTCYCLDASTGTNHGQASSGVTIDTIECGVSQKATIARTAKLSVKISNLALSNLPTVTRPKVVRYYKNKIENSAKVVVSNARLESGSIVFKADLLEDPTSAIPSDTNDLPSIVAGLEQVINEPVLIDDFVFEAEEAPEFAFSTEELTEPTTTAKPTKDPGPNTGLIIGIVVGAVALLLIVIVAIVLCNRSKKNKGSSMQFSDLKGKENPMYARP